MHIRVLLTPKDNEHSMCMKELEKKTEKTVNERKRKKNVAAFKENDFSYLIVLSSVVNLSTGISIQLN